MYLLLQSMGVAQCLIGRQRHRVIDDPAFEPFDAANLARLFANVQVAVDHSHPTSLRHADGHLRLCHCVHGGRQKRDVQLDALRNPRPSPSHQLGSTSEAPGTSRTSSNVSASRISMGLSRRCRYWRPHISWAATNGKPDIVPLGEMPRCIRTHGCRLVTKQDLAISGDAFALPPDLAPRIDIQPIRAHPHLLDRDRVTA